MLKTLKEKLYALEKVYERLIACDNVSDRLS